MLFSDIVKSKIVIRGARQHNLKNIDLEIPRRSVVVITGPSGSGKSSLAFDTIYAEGQRRYVESLSAYARQFLERMEKPDVDHIDGLSPSIAIEQKNPTKTARSTVGTATEIYDYLRLLWARVGHTFCPHCGREMRPDTVQSVVDTVLSLPEGTRFSVAFPLALSDLVTEQAVIENLRAQGFVRLFLDGKTRHLDEMNVGASEITRARERFVVVDRLVVGSDTERRLTDAVGTTFAEGECECVILLASPIRLHPEAEPLDRLRFTERFECAYDGTKAPTPAPQLFSFNNPRGACPTCNGFGAVLEYDETLVIPHPERTLREGAIDPWTKPRYDKKRRALADFARQNGIAVDVSWRDLTNDARQLLLHGRGRGYKGIFKFLRDLEEKRYKQYIRVFLRQYQTAMECPSCHGARLRPEALAVRIAGVTIAEASAFPLERLACWLQAIPLSEFDQRVAENVLREATTRTRFLLDVGLGYLTLDRGMRSLSGGEAQRIGLANSLGSQLVDTLYVLDEPSIGLHPRDLGKLLLLLQRLRAGGNSVIVVEHDLDAIRAADYMVELGPGSGENGGEVVWSGPIARVAESSLTGAYLTGEKSVPVPTERRPLGPRWITLTGAREHNLRGVDLRIPLGAFTVVTGVSGSGKSTLIHDVLYRALEQRLRGEHSAKRHLGERVGDFDTIEGYESLDDVVLVDQAPIGRSARSNPVTYVKAFDEVRRIFAETPAAKQRGLSAGAFSFNVAGGRCDTCEGAGHLQIEMVFMADVFVPCDVCGGKRYKPSVLDVRVRGKNIHEVLQFTIDAAIRFFPREERLGHALWQLQQVGLGYLRLGQPAPTLSGGEAQRIKIARELAQAGRTRERKLYIMDEPTTGLHLEDIRKLARVLDRLVEQGNTLVLIEHNLDVIKLADWVIDLGPEAGAGGGEIVSAGRPEEVAKVERSHTGRWLRTVLSGSARGSPVAINPELRAEAVS